MPAEPMEPEELLGYFQIHSRTERALFHKLHYAQLRKLAGDPVSPLVYDQMLDFFSVPPNEADPLIEKARARMTANPPPPGGWDDDPLE